MANREKLTREQVIEALENVNGMVYLAAESLGVTARTVYNYAARYVSVQEAIDQSRGKVLDMAEQALYSAILKSEHWAVTFALRTIGKDRGYTERTEQEITGKEGGPVEIDVTEIIVEIPSDEPMADSE